MEEIDVLMMRLLPKALRRVVRSYERFMNAPEKSDAKDFKAHHDACRAALAHIEALRKLSRGGDMDEEDAAAAELAAMIAQAEKALRSRGQGAG